jgi:hypothetical protein
LGAGNFLAHRRRDGDGDKQAQKRGWRVSRHGSQSVPGGAGAQA